MKFRYFIAVLMLMAVSSTVNAVSLFSTKDYLAARKKMATRIAFEALKESPGSYTGKVFELRGTLTGFVKNETGCTLIVTAKDGSHYINADSLPPVSTGSELLMLVKIGEGSTYSLSDLRLVACTWGALLRPPEPAKPAPVPEAKKTTPTKVKEKTSRGGVSKDDFIYAYVRAVQSCNPKLTTQQADTIARSILGFSTHYNVDPKLVFAVILAESHFKPSATSRCGAAGLGQLMPGTAAGLGVHNAYDPVENVYGSVRYIKSMLDRMSGNKEWNELTWYDLGLAIAAYNAGPGAVKKHGGIPPYRETQNYVRKVVSIYKKLCGVN